MRGIVYDSGRIVRFPAGPGKDRSEFFHGLFVIETPDRIAPRHLRAEPHSQMAAARPELPYMAVDLDIVKKGGAWFSYGEMKLGQGRDNSKENLLNNPDIMKEIEDKIKEKLNAEQAAEKLKKKDELEAKANAAAASQAKQETAAEPEEEEAPKGKKIRKTVSESASVTADAENDFQEFAPIDVSKLGEG